MDYVVNPNMSPNMLNNDGLKIIISGENGKTLKKHKIEMSDLSTTKNLTQFKNAPIGLIYDSDFTFTNNFNQRMHKKYKIAKNLQKTYNLNSDQKKVMKVIANEFNKIYAKKLPIYLCLQANCGFGKTIIAINFILKCEYNKAFVVTHNKFAAFQFQARVKQFLPQATTYVSDDGVLSLLKLIETDDYQSPDILIFPSRHLSDNQFLLHLRRNYALGIIDEAHVNNFANESSLRTFYTEHVFPVVLSMTATPRLDNSLYIGKLIKSSDYVKENTPFQKNFIAVVSDKTLDKYQHSSAYKQYMKSQQNCRHVRKMQCIADDTNRKSLILSHIIHHHQSSNSRIVVLVEFIEEAKHYSSCLREKGIECLIRISKQEVNEAVQEYTKEKEKYIIIGTVDKLGTGFDLPSCNTIFLTSLYNTQTDIQQYAGRCIRKYEPDNNATRTIYVFFIRPHPDLNIRNFYINTTKALKEIGWTTIVRTIHESI